MDAEKFSNVRVFQDLDAMVTAAAEIFCLVADQANLERKRVLVALSGGSTPKGLYKTLATPPFKDRLPWSRIHLFWCDERLVPPWHAESNFGQALELLFSRVNIPEENLHRIRGEILPEQAVEEYRRELEIYSTGDLKWPRFDLAFLGLGADGHTASLFPGLIDPQEKSSPVIAVTAEYQGRPAGRITLTPLVLNGARNLIFLVAGRDKAYAVARSLQGLKDPVMWPAQRIQPMNGKLLWLLDGQAANWEDASK